MKMKQFLVGACALTLLASCSGGGENKETDVNKIIDGFATSLTGTAKVTFNSKYKVDVESEKGGMDSFKHDVDDKVVAEFDLNKDNLYLYVKNDAKDGTNAKTREALLYKDGSSYKYVTSVMENPLTLASEDAARAKIDELLNKISSNLAGYLDTSSLLFANGGVYEHSQFGLGTENIAAEDFISSPDITTNNGGIKVSGSLDYIGYHTDAGISDFPGKDGTPASTYEINTNELGYVTSYTQNMDASLAMPIMNPAPIVTIKGAKSLNATYGEELTKKTTIAHELTTTKLEIAPSTFGTVETFVTPTIDGTKAPVADKATLTVGQFLAVKVTPAGTNTIKMVTFAGSSKDTPEADGYFYFEIPEGKASLTVNYVGADQIAGVKNATLNPTIGEGLTVTAKWFTLVNGSPDAMKDVVDNKVPVGKDNWVAYTVTAPEGKTVVAKCNDNDMTFLMGAYCVNVKEEKTYNINITTADAVAPTFGTLVAPYVVTGGKAVYMTCKMGDFQNMKPINGTTELVKDELICIKVTPDTGCSVKSIKVNGNSEMLPAANAGGWYCYKIVEGENKVEIIMEGSLPTEGKIAFTKDDNVTALAVKPFVMNGGRPEFDTSKEYAVGDNVPTGNGKFVAVEATLANGKTLDKVIVNGKEINKQFGMYFFEIKQAGTYEVTVTTK